MISCCSGSLLSNSTSSVLKSSDKKTTPKRRNRTTQTPRTQIQHIAKYSHPSRLKPPRLVFLPPANEVWGKVISLQASVHRGGYLTSSQGAVPDQFTGGGVPGQTPPRQRPHSGQTPPRTKYTPPRADPRVHPLLGLSTPPADIRSTRGRYASYWNAILLLVYVDVKFYCFVLFTY